MGQAFFVFGTGPKTKIPSYISPSVSRAPRSAPASMRTVRHPEIEREPEAEDNAPFVYRYDDDGVDEGLEAAPEDAAEPLSEEAQAALDLEQKANEIFAQYLKAIAENPDPDDWDNQHNTAPP